MMMVMAGTAKKASFVYATNNKIFLGFFFFFFVVVVIVAFRTWKEKSFEFSAHWKIDEWTFTAIGTIDLRLQNRWDITHQQWQLANKTPFKIQTLFFTRKKASHTISHYYCSKQYNMSDERNPAYSYRRTK
jgi:hypothetical protein